MHPNWEIQMKIFILFTMIWLSSEITLDIGPQNILIANVDESQAIVGTICNKSAGVAEAKVFCRTLDLSSYGAKIVAVPNANQMALDAIPMVLSDVRCTGQESNINLCKYNTTVINCHYDHVIGVSCGHSQDAGVTVSSQPQNLITTSRSIVTARLGRLNLLLITKDGKTGTVCNDDFISSNARVVCRMMGLTTQNARYLQLGRMGFGGDASMEIALDDVTCRGDEQNIDDCEHNVWWTHDCGHHEDVGIQCGGEPDIFTTIPPNRVSVRLGRHNLLLVTQNGRTGTVCNDEFTTSAAKVFCRMMNLPADYAEVLQLGRAGLGGSRLMPIILDEVDCEGHEEHIDQCRHERWFRNDCTHREDVGVLCPEYGNSTAEPSKARGNYSFDESSSNATVSLGPNGLLYVTKNGITGTVCNDHFGDNDAKVVCRMLGQPTENARALELGRRNLGGPKRMQIMLDEVNCEGNEMNIQDCAHQPWMRHDCSHNEDIGVSCNKTVGETSLKASLGPNDLLLLTRHGETGTVCNDNFDERDAKVACRMLGLATTFTQHIELGRMGQGANYSTKIILDELECTGDELSLADCKHGPWWSHDCSHAEDIGIYCSDVKAMTTSIPPTYHYRHYHGMYSTYLPDEDITSELSVELRENGLLIVTRNGRNGTVCNDNFDNNDAKVVCRMLNLTTTNARYIELGRRGLGGDESLDIALDDLHCSGRESSLEYCSHRRWWSHDCGHNEDVGVSCGGEYAPNSTADSAPAKVSMNSEGLVLVTKFGRTGTICDDQFGVNDARVVCRMLGRPTYHARVLTQRIGQNYYSHFQMRRPHIYSRLSKYRHGQNDVRRRLFEYERYRGRVRMFPIALDDLDCNGTEMNIEDCSHSGWFLHDCTPNENVKVSCSVSASEVTEGPFTTAEVKLDPSGLLWVTKNGRTGTVCNDEFGTDEAKVVCRMLKLPTENARTIELGRQGRGGGRYRSIALDDVSCDGTESNIEECNHRAWFTSDCTHAEDIGVSCDTYASNKNASNSVTVKLGKFGLVLLTKNGKTGTVCNDNFSDEDAQVICRMLGMATENARALELGRQGKGGSRSLPIALDEVECNGFESNIDHCPHEQWWTTDCGHNEDIGVSCESSQIESTVYPRTVPSSYWSSCLSFGGRGYEFKKTSLVFKDAAVSCLLSGSMLTPVRNKAHNMFLSNSRHTETKRNWWLGITDITKESTFVNLDGGRINYTDWETDEPNNVGNEDCVNLGIGAKRHKWNDVKCDVQERSICEYDSPSCEKKPGVCASFNGKKYLFVQLGKTWHEANNICRVLNMELVSVQNQAHMNWLSTRAYGINENWWWIGLSDTRKEGSFSWSDGSKSSYRNFHNGEPNSFSNDEDCVHFGFFRGDNTWNDHSCNNKAFFICEGDHNTCSVN